MFYPSGISGGQTLGDERYPAELVGGMGRSGVSVRAVGC